MKRIFVLFSALLLAGSATAQIKRTWHWYFGFQAGIDFSSGQPVTDTSGVMESIEGSAVLSDTAGQLLYYTQGEKLYNRNHTVTPNGSSIDGNASAVQSSLFVPVANSTLCYLFTNYYDWNNSTYSLKYSVIDHTLNSGLGDIITGQKNILLTNNGSEALAGVMHCDRTSTWIATRVNQGGVLYVYTYRVSASGIWGPVISPAVASTTFDVVGELRYASDGSLLAAATTNTDIFIYDFNNNTGTLSPRDTLPLQSLWGEMTYSTAFSPDRTKLYVSSWKAGVNCYISQFDLTAPDPALTRVLLDSVDFSNGSPNGYGFCGRLQPGPDGRIYLSRWNQNNPYQVNQNTYYSLDSLDVIHFPNVTGAGCQLQRNFLWLQRRPTEIGLPNFIESWFNTAPPSSDPCIAIGMAPVQQETIEALTDPFGKQVHFRWQGAIETLLLYDMTGKVVQAIDANGRAEAAFSTADLPAGIYCVQAVKDGAAVGAAKFAVL